MGSNSKGAAGDEASISAGGTTDRSMRALLLDEEASEPEKGVERPLRLQREGDADTGAVSAPRSAGPGRDKTGSSPGAGQSSDDRRTTGGRAPISGMGASGRGEPPLSGEG